MTEEDSYDNTPFDPHDNTYTQSEKDRLAAKRAAESATAPGGGGSAATFALGGANGRTGEPGGDAVSREEIVL